MKYKDAQQAEKKTLSCGSSVEYLVQIGNDNKIIITDCITEQLEMHTIGTHCCNSISDFYFRTPSCFFFQHNHKKLRNNVLGSGKENFHKRLLQPLHVGNVFILWRHWTEAAAWDQAENSFPVFQKLTTEHLAPNQRDKMRNHLAEDVLGPKMLHLMKVIETKYITIALVNTGDQQ